MTDSSQPLRDILSELDALRASNAQHQQNIKGIAVCLALSQIQNGPLEYEADAELAEKLLNANLRLRWDAAGGPGQLVVSLEGLESPLERSDVMPLPELRVLPDPEESANPDTPAGDNPPA